jgi:hypothetical protein
MSFARPAFSRQARQAFARLGLEQLERRELMAGLDLQPASTAPGFCGPLPLVPDVVATGPAAPTPTRTIGRTDFGHGNITAELIGGVLTIRGDSAGNRFSIYGFAVGDGIWHLNSNRYFEQQLAADQTISVVPRNTLINGQWLTGATQALSFTGVTAIDIDLGDGDDLVEIWAIKTPQLTIRTGNGNDEVILRGLMPARMAYTDVWLEYPAIDGPRGDMYASPQPLHVEGDLFIDTGAGNDRLSPFAAVDGDATVQMGDGDDSYIEVPYQLNQVFVQPDPVTGQYPPPERVIGKLTATGDVSIDLEPDQDVENIPDNWQDDSHLVSHIQNVPRVLDYYQGMVERGEATPGVAQVFTPPFPDSLAAVDAQGRLEIEFGFTQGFGRVIERLLARGVTIDAYSIARGIARAVVREDDLKLFANLPGLGYFHTRIPGYREVLAPEWDFVRPGSSTAAEDNLAENDENESNSTVTTGPTFGPAPWQDALAATEGLSLHDWYYGTEEMGPKPLF